MLEALKKEKCVIQEMQTKEKSKNKEGVKERFQELKMHISIISQCSHPISSSVNRFLHP